MRIAVLLVALLLGACAHQPAQVAKPDRAAAAKKSAPVTAAPVAQPTANQAVKKRWYDGFRVRWFSK